MKRKRAKVSKSVRVPYKELLVKEKLRLEWNRNRVRSCRDNKKKKKLIPKRVLRSIKRISNVCNLISDKTNGFLPLSTLERIKSE